MQAASSKIWTFVALFTFYGNNQYTIVAETEE